MDVDSAPGHNVDSTSGQNMDIDCGQVESASGNNVDSASEHNVDIDCGQVDSTPRHNVDITSGHNVDTRNGQNMDIDGEQVDSAPGYNVDNDCGQGDSASGQSVDRANVDIESAPENNVDSDCGQADSTPGRNVDDTSGLNTGIDCGKVVHNGSEQVDSTCGQDMDTESEHDVADSTTDEPCEDSTGFEHVKTENAAPDLNKVSFVKTEQFPDIKRHVIKIEAEEMTKQVETDDEASDVSTNKATLIEYKCTKPGCDKVFHRPDRLKKHILFHGNERQFVCGMLSCGKSYITAQHLRRHHLMAHTDERKASTVKCDDANCPKTFPNNSSMKKHYKNSHVNKKTRYSCEECDASFFYCAEYYIHMDEEHGIKKLYCDICKITFTSQSDRTRHMRGHRTWTCNEGNCDGVFFTNFFEKRKHDAVVHPILHTCYHCNFHASRKLFLEEHIIRKHMSEWDRPLLGCTYRDCRKTFLHERNYVAHYRKAHLHEGTIFDCPLGCPQKFASKQSAQRHVVKIHEKMAGQEEPEMPYPCKYCWKKFGKEKNLRRHMLKMHSDRPLPSARKLVNSVYVKSETGEGGLKKKKKKKLKKKGDKKRRLKHRVKKEPKYEPYFDDDFKFNAVPINYDSD